MIELYVIGCWIVGATEYCKTYSLGQAENTLPYTCFRVAQKRAVNWHKSHPTHTIKKYGCSRKLPLPENVG